MLVGKVEYGYLYSRNLLNRWICDKVRAEGGDNDHDHVIIDITLKENQKRKSNRFTS
jgi:hypothetical protein